MYQILLMPLHIYVSSHLLIIDIILTLSNPKSTPFILFLMLCTNEKRSVDFGDSNTWSSASVRPLFEFAINQYRNSLTHTNVNKTAGETMRTMSNIVSDADKNNQNSNNSHIVEEVIHLLPSAEMLRHIMNTLMDCIRKGMTSILFQKNKKQKKKVREELVGGVERSEVDTNTNDPLVDEEEEEEVVNDYEDTLMMDKTSIRGNLLLLTLLQDQIMSCPLPLSSSQRPWLPVRLDQNVYLKFIILRL